MRILFFSHYFPPEVNAPANRTHENCREWVAAGHEVHVITCVPSHPVGAPFEGYHRGFYQHEELDGIHVHRVWTHLAPNRGVIRRTLNYLSFVPSAVFRGWQLGTFDLAIGTSPQFFCAVATWLYAFTRRVPWVFELRDLWPASITAVGVMRPSVLLRGVQVIEMQMYRSAAAVVCVTRSFIDNLAERGIDRGKLHFVPNGILADVWRSGDRRSGRRTLGVTDATVVASFVGTIGMAHGLTTALEAAALLQTSAPEVQLLIVGEGAELAQLRALVAERRLTNVQFTGLKRRDDIPSLMAATDISLVILKPDPVFKTVLPSKMFEAMAARRPVVLGVEGEAKDTLMLAHGGLAVEPGSAAALADAVVKLAHDPALRAQLGSSGGEYVEREFSRTTWAARYLVILRALVAAPSGPVRPLAEPTRVE